MSCLCGAVRRTPLFLCVFTLIALFITYGIAVGVGHVRPLLPYISDTGAYPPESCLFGLFLSVVAFVLCMVIYVRYRQVSEFSKLYPNVGITPLWNRIAASLGFLSCLGLDMVACFQETSDFITHIVGAMLCFFSATLYFFFQTIFTRKMHPEKKCFLWLRSVFTLLNVLFIVGTFAPVGVALKNFKGDNKLQWKDTDGGYAYHLMSTFSEWFLIFSFCSYICTFHWDFGRIKIEPPVVKFLNLENGNANEEGDSSAEGVNTQKFVI